MMRVMELVKQEGDAFIKTNRSSFPHERLFVLASAVTLQWFPRKWLTGGSAIVAVFYVGGVAAAVSFAPATSLIAVSYGPWVTLAGAIALAIGALVHQPTR